MFTYIYDWIRNIAFYLVIMAVILKLLPDSEYRKYIRFFTGLLLLMLLIKPLLSGFGLADEFDRLFGSIRYRQDVKEMEDAAEYFKSAEEGYLKWRDEMAPEAPEKTGDAGKE